MEKYQQTIDCLLEQLEIALYNNPTKNIHQVISDALLLKSPTLFDKRNNRKTAIRATNQDIATALKLYNKVRWEDSCNARQNRSV